MRDAIAQIGAAMVACSSPCAGIHRDQTIGSLPRCLVLEEREGGTGCAIVGINPGRASARERAYYLEHGCSYESVVSFWRDVNGFRHPYYTRLRKLVDALGLSSSILWTELAKCENAPDRAGLPPLQTLRTCTGLYLAREILVLPPSWPLVSVGGEAFKACAYLYPRRAVIGVPHPSGSRGHFARLARSTQSVRERVSLALAGASAIWLDAR
jgi:hypothetical protein